MSTTQEQAAKKPYLTTAELAKRVGCSTPTIRKLVRDGKIAGFQVGNRVRFTDADVVACLASLRINDGGGK